MPSRTIARAVFTAVVLLAGCAAGHPTAATESPARQAAVPGSTARKVMVIAEENETYEAIMGNRAAPHLNAIAARYGVGRAAEAGYPVHCPSLPAYLIMTSGSTHGICDDAPAADHRLDGESIFSQVASAGRQWRGYAESMPGNCARTDTARYLSRHAPAAYYRSQTANCRRWDVPLGSVAAGPLVRDLAAGTLPAYSFVTPDVCHEMHGGSPCRHHLIAAADAWMGTLLPMIEASPDFRSGRLVVFITWDEGSSSSNHIPFLVLSRNARRVASTAPFTLCSLLRTSEDLLTLPALGCASTSRSLVNEFHL